MPDNALAAILLANQRRQYDPADRSRKYAQALMEQGSSTAPVQSPLEGVARALTGGLGGFFAGQADRAEKEKNQNTTSGLLDFANAKTDDERAAAQAKLKDADPSIVAALASQLIDRNMESQRAAAAGQGFGNAYGGGAPAAGGGPLSVPIDPSAASAPLPDANLPAGSFANNTGNIRATPGVSFPGQGAPQNGFMTFDTPQSGVNAQRANLASYVQQNPTMTVAQAISKWAPPSENNTDQYIRQVAESTGINPGMPLAEVLKDPAVGAQLLDAMTRKEKGGLPAGVTADTFMAANTPGAQPQPTPQAGPQVAQATPAQGDSQPPVAGAPAQVGDSTTSGPPAVPKPKPTPEQLRRYQALISTPGSGVTAEKASQQLEAELNQQWAADKQVALETWKDQQASKRQNEKAAIDLGQKAPMEAIGKLTDNYFTKTRPAAEAASSTIANIHQTRQLLDAGAFTGTGGEAKLALGRLAEAVGMEPSAATANTQALQATLAKQVIAGMGGSLGTGVSNADRDFMEKANAGQITWTDQSLRKLLDINERVARRTLSNHDVEAARVKNLPGMGNLGADQYAVSPAPSYEDWKKANPPLGAPAAAPQGGGNIPVISDPAEAAKLPSGTPFRTPDGRQLWVP